MRNRLMIKDRGSSSSSSTSSSQLSHHPPHTRKPKLALLREVFGRGGFVLVIYISAAIWNAPPTSIPPRGLIMSLVDRYITDVDSGFIFECPGFLCRFSLLLASSSPLQSSFSWRHHVLRPAPLRRLTFDQRTWRRWQERWCVCVRACVWVHVCVCACVWVTVNEFSAYSNYDVLSLDLRGKAEEGWRPRLGKYCVLHEWINAGQCVYLYPPGQQRFSLRSQTHENLFLSHYTNSCKGPILSGFVVLMTSILLFWLVWKVRPLMDTLVWLIRLMSIFLQWGCWYQMYYPT